MKPSVCRMVQVFVDPHHNNGADVAPAIITRVWSDTCINLRVIHDGPADGGPNRQDWMTSVTLYETREAAETDHAAKWEHLPAEQRPSRPFGAFWPPRVEGERPPGAISTSSFRPDH